MENNSVENKDELPKDDVLAEELARTVQNVEQNTIMWVECSIRLLAYHLSKIGEKFDPKKCQWSYEPMVVRYDGKTFAKIKLLLPDNEKKIVLEG